MVGLGRGPGPHSQLSAEDFEAARARADGRLAVHGVTACEAIRSPRRGNTRLQALRELSVARLNQAVQLLHSGCLVKIQGEDRSAGEVMAEIDELLEAGGRNDERRAAQLGHALSTGRVSDPN